VTVVGVESHNVFGVYEVLYLLFLPGYTFFEQVKKTLSLLLMSFGSGRPPKLGARSPRPHLFQSLAYRLPVD
jgi:hypothetical protein